MLTIDNSVQSKKFHPTQKPIEIAEYIIKTYTREGEGVLDPFMGSGTAAIACINTKRKFIGGDLEYFDKSSKRIEEAFIKTFE